MKIRHCCSKLFFLIGVVLGILLAVLLQKPKYENNNKAERPEQTPFKANNQKITKKLAEAGKTDDEVILCVILVKKEKNAKAAVDTWAKSCDKVAFLHIGSNKKIVMPKQKRRDSSWTMLCKLLTDDETRLANWVVVVHDYTFVLVENLKYFVSQLDSNRSYYLGHSVKFWNTIYNKGQAGYVLSRGALERFKQKLQNGNSCDNSLTYLNREDYYLGKHLAELDITPADTRDENGFTTFHPENLYREFYAKGANSFQELSIYPRTCCSPRTITFHGIECDKMYTFHYILYKVKTYTGGYFREKNKPATLLTNDEMVWKNFLRSMNYSTNVTAKEYYKIWENLVDSPMAFAQHIKDQNRDQNFMET